MTMPEPKEGEVFWTNRLTGERVPPPSWASGETPMHRRADAAPVWTHRRTGEPMAAPTDERSSPGDCDCSSGTCHCTRLDTDKNVGAAKALEKEKETMRSSKIKFRHDADTDEGKVEASDAFETFLGEFKKFLGDVKFTEAEGARLVDAVVDHVESSGDKSDDAEAGDDGARTRTDANEGSQRTELALIMARARKNRDRTILEAGRATRRG